MKKFSIIIAIVASIGMAAFALFKILTTQNDGNSETSPREAEAESRKEETQRSEAEGKAESQI